MAISVDPTDPDRQVIAVTRPGDPVSSIRTFRTVDGGRTWQESTMLPPAIQGYDVLRARAASLFGVCLESDDASDTVALDQGVPGPGGVYHYLVRAVNVCGDGSLGQDSTGSARNGPACP